MKLRGALNAKFIIFVLLSAVFTFFLLVMNKEFVLSRLKSTAISPQTIATPNGEVERNIPKVEYKPETPLIINRFEMPSFASLKVKDVDSNLRSPKATSVVPPQEQSPVGSISAKVPTQVSPKPKQKEVVTELKSSKNQRNESVVITSGIHCSKAFHDNYTRVDDAETAAENMKWCKQARDHHRVRIGFSWGSMDKGDQMRWDEKTCNELLAIGKLQSCEERWGWSRFNTWTANKKQVFSQSSDVQCMLDFKSTSYCTMKNVTMDFSKMSHHGGTRQFSSGFLTVYGAMHHANYSALPAYPGLVYAQPHIPYDPTQCDSTEHRPTYILSNDDIFNLGHYMNDVLTVWQMVTMSNHSFAEALLVNIDGVRDGGPAGGPAHRLMLPHAPDTHGPYSPYYFEQWFGEVRQGVSYARKRICFSELHLFPVPGVPWFWNEWGRVDECSAQAQSPLYQSFATLLRQSLLDHNHTLLNPPAAPEPLHVVIEVREINPAKRNAHASARYMRNLGAVVHALQSISGIRVTAQNFAALTFLQQIQLAHTANILISAHGAGTTHIFHMALGQTDCCALLELFPDTSVDLYTAQGYGNLARMLGLKHTRFVAGSGSTTGHGTYFDPQAIKTKVLELMARIRQAPTCLHDVRDTRYPVMD